MRYALRMLRKSPGFTTVAVFSLMLGIGANSVMFSIVHAVLVRPLPYPDSGRLVFVWSTPPNHPEQKRAGRAADFFALREHSRTLEHIGTVGGVEDTANFGGAPGELPEQVEGQRFAAAVPLALGAQPFMGRWFTDAEAQPGASPVIVIAWRLWQRRFGGAADIVGRRVRMDGETAAIVGVMPQGWMFFNYPAQYWAPYRLGRTAAGGDQPVLPLARLRAGVTMRQAQGEMDSLAAASQGWGMRLEPALDLYVGWIRQPLAIAQGVVVLVLLIACANVAGLQVARVVARRNEIAVRAALGAGRWRIAQPFLMESLLLSLAGGLGGVALAKGGLKLFVAISPAWFPRVEEIRLDTTTLGFTILLSLGAGLAFGALPALASPGRDRHKARSFLVVAEVSAALVLLIGAGLMLKTLAGLYSAPPGCDPRNVITFQVQLPSPLVTWRGREGSRATAEISPRVNARFERIRERIGAIHGVESVAAGVSPPLSETALGSLSVNFNIEGRREDGAERQPPGAAWFPVSAGYFQTLRVPLVAGREFGSADTAAGLPVVLINQAMARCFWPGENPLGRRLRIDAPDEPSREIVGVTGDLRHNRRDREAQPQIYVPYVQEPLVTQGRWVESRLTMTYVVRSTGDPRWLVPALRAAVAEVDGDLPIFHIKTLNEYIGEQLWQPAQTTTLLGIFGAIAVLLAMTGVYGIMAYETRRRTHEIGIRMALGASRRHVLRLVSARVLMLVVPGVAIGMAASFAATRLLGTLLWGVTPADPATYAAATVALVTAAIVASYLPARRALSTEPTAALRHE